MSAEIGAKRRPAPTGRDRQNAELRALIGQRLVAQGHLKQEDLDRMLLHQKGLPLDQPVRRLGSLLIEAGLVSMRHVSEALGAQRGVQAQSTAPGRLDPNVRALFPKDLLLQVQAVPVSIIGKTVAVAMADPQDTAQVALLQAHTHHPVRPVQAPQIQILQLLATIKTVGPSFTTPTPTPGSPRPAEASMVQAAATAAQSSPRLPKLSTSSASGSRSGSHRSGTEMSATSAIADVQQAWKATSALSPRDMVIISSQSGQSGASGRASASAPGTSTRSSRESAASGRAISGASSSGPQIATPTDLPPPASAVSGGEATSARSTPGGAGHKQKKGMPVKGPREILSDLKEYQPWAVAFLLTLSIAGAGYFLVKQREDRIKETAATPLPPKPKPAVVAPVAPSGEEPSPVPIEEAQAQ